MGKVVNVNRQENRVSLAKVGRTKKITGTRFAAILGKNRWSTAFETWCDITGAYKKPFVKTIFTEAGKIIEPLQIQWYKDNYFANVLTPEERYGYDPFKTTFGNFFNGKKANQLGAGNFDDPKDDILGGMWDGIELDENDNPIGVIECKSTKRAQDWSEDEAPEYYEYQAVLYAYLLGLDRVTMIATFLDDEDYHGADGNTKGEELDVALGKLRENIVVDNNNTMAFTFSIKERYPDIEKAVEYARDWWEKHVVTGKSPAFDMSSKDKEIIRAFGTEILDNPDDEIIKLAKEIDDKELRLALLKESMGINDLEKEIKDSKDLLKLKAEDSFGDDNEYIEIITDKNKYTLSKQITNRISKKLLEEDGVLEKYQTASESIVLRSAKLD